MPFRSPRLSLTYTVLPRSAEARPVGPSSPAEQESAVFRYVFLFVCGDTPSGYDSPEVLSGPHPTEASGYRASGVSKCIGWRSSTSSSPEP